jgi:hypothetical protein
MAKTFKADFNFRTIWEYVNTPDSAVADAPSIKDNNTLLITDNLTNGTGTADVASKIYHDIRTLAHSSNEEFDLAGVLEDAFGDVLTFTIVRGLFIINKELSSAAPVLEVGGATNAFSSIFGSATDKVKVAGAGMIAFWNPTVAGYAVTASTADIIKVANTHGADSCTYQIVIIGE